ncbi:MAG: methyl-accepting chemotaxis protein, partial [Deltaproteobacteria bacterium]|nr:methyl-accepting chemotaxis protein [Deltaproteobacteria bacterium]
EAKESTRKFSETVNNSEKFLKKSTSADLLAFLKKEIPKFDALIDEIQQSNAGNTRHYREGVLTEARAVIAQLNRMASGAEEARNHAALGAIAKVWTDMTSFMSGVSRYSNSHRKEDALIVKEDLARLNVSLDGLAGTLSADAGKGDLALLKTQYAKLASAVTDMIELSTKLMKDIDEMNAFLAVVLSKTKELSQFINRQMHQFGSATLESNANAQKAMMATGSIGLLLGIGIATLIVFSIIKVLRELAAFAQAVSRGDFSYRIAIKEKGEINVMIGALKEIPAVLERIIVTARDMSNNIRMGRLRDRLDAGSLNGSFSQLGLAVNTVSDAFSGLIDAIPLPVVACDKNFAVVYSNKSGREVLGGEAVSSRPDDRTSSPDQALDTSFGKQAMSGKTAVSGETVMHPQGKKMEVAVTAIPLLDAGGAATGFVEIITDLTEIKEKQATMLKVARDASTISDRVAAASEELAAQVEQISRGAEIQRERVESTASAMNQMNSTVLEVARSASQASEQSEGARSKAQKGAQLVGKVVDAIHRVDEVGGKLHGNMQELGQQAQSIGGIMNVISDIADQTNLLALNAAIEAARAGEAGRGFAVVADEVRKLAEKTMEATQQVGSNINAIQYSTRINIEEVDNAVKSVGEATELANASGEALQEILNLVVTNSSVVASIATAAEEQSSTSEEINNAVEEINRITSETTDGMTQSSEAVQELSRMAQELRRVMEGLR